jgi:hypothetical protein
MHSQLIDKTMGEIVKNACMQHTILYRLCRVPKLDHLGGYSIYIVMHMQQLTGARVAYHTPSLGFARGLCC